MTYTHQKRPYRAEVITWDGENIEEIRSLLDTASTWGATQLMVRWKDSETGRSGIETMNIGDVVVKGENNKITIYTKAVFDIKYEKIDSDQQLPYNG